jgi:hypothetical protein
MYEYRRISAEKLHRIFHMYRRKPRHQLSFEDFFLPFGGKLSGDNRWIKLAEPIPWEDLEAELLSSHYPSPGLRLQSHCLADGQGFPESP